MYELHRAWIAHGPVELVVDATAPALLPVVHPLITAVSPPRPDGAGERWSIDERVPLGPFSIPNHYEARRERIAPDRLVLEAWSRPAVHLVHTLVFVPDPAGTRVEHTVRIEAPWYVRSFVVSTARRAHDEWIERVRAWVAAEATRRASVGA